MMTIKELNEKHGQLKGKLEGNALVLRNDKGVVVERINIKERNSIMSIAEATKKHPCKEVSIVLTEEDIEKVETRMREFNDFIHRYRKKQKRREALKVKNILKRIYRYLFML